MKTFRLFCLLSLGLSTFSSWASPSSPPMLIARSSADRASVELTATNRDWRGWVCDKLAMEIVLEDPATLLEATRIYLDVPKFFTPSLQEGRKYGKEFLRNEVLQLRSETASGLIVKSAILKTDKMACTPATFDDYCKLAAKDAHEAFTIKQLERHYNRTGCTDLAEKLSDKKKLNLNGLDIADFRFIKYLPYLRRVAVYETFKDRSKTLGALPWVYVDGIREQRSE